jgi:hypothetical protein
MNSHPSPERWRPQSDIDRDIEHFANGDGHELGLWTRILEVQTANDSSARARDVILNETRQAGRDRILFSPELSECAARVAKDRSFQNSDARQRRRAPPRYIRHRDCSWVVLLTADSAVLH